MQGDRLMRKTATRPTEIEARLFAENLILTSDTYGVEGVVVYEQVALFGEETGSTWGISWIEWTS